MKEDRTDRRCVTSGTVVYCFLVVRVGVNANGRNERWNDGGCDVERTKKVCEVVRRAAA